MPKDHCVADTYLKHFIGDGKMLNVYRKSNGVYFPCHPNDICRGLDLQSELLRYEYLQRMTSVTPSNYDLDSARAKTRQIEDYSPL